MKLNMRTLAVSVLSSGLIALGSSVAIAQTVNNIDNTTPGMSGHGTGCSNFAGGCNGTQVSSTRGYQPSADATTNTNMNSSTATPESAPLNNCVDAADATPGHCMSGGTNK